MIWNAINLTSLHLLNLLTHNKWNCRRRHQSARGLVTDDSSSNPINFTSPPIFLLPYIERAAANGFLNIRRRKLLVNVLNHRRWLEHRYNFRIIHTGALLLMYGVLISWDRSNSGSTKFPAWNKSLKTTLATSVKWNVITPHFLYYG